MDLVAQAAEAEGYQQAAIKIKLVWNWAEDDLPSGVFHREESVEAARAFVRGMHPPSDVIWSSTFTSADRLHLRASLHGRAFPGWVQVRARFNDADVAARLADVAKDAVDHYRSDHPPPEASDPDTGSSESDADKDELPRAGEEGGRARWRDELRKPTHAIPLFGIFFAALVSVLIAILD
jgi:hypothetical protein